MSILLQDSAEESVRERNVTDMAYALACHLLHSTQGLVDGITLLTDLVQIWSHWGSE